MNSTQRKLPGRGDRGRLVRLGTVGLAVGLVLVGVHCDTLLPRHGWNAQWGPVLPHKSFPADCSICHSTEGWDTLRDDFVFDHEKETGRALVGAHAEAECLRCHNDRGPVQAYASRGCSGCHMDPHKSTLGLDCGRCHDEETWSPGASVADHARTQFPLVGLHAVTPCESCHLRASVGDFRGASTRCELCHQDDLGRATVPDHVSRGWTTGCDRCHSPLGWDRATVGWIVPAPSPGRDRVEGWRYPFALVSARTRP